MSDLISREEAIQVINDLLDIYVPNESQYDSGAEDNCKKIIALIKSLPTAEPLVDATTLAKAIDAVSDLKDAPIILTPTQYNILKEHSDSISEKDGVIKWYGIQILVQEVEM